MGPKLADIAIVGSATLLLVFFFGFQSLRISDPQQVIVDLVQQQQHKHSLRTGSDVNKNVGGRKLLHTKNRNDVQKSGNTNEKSRKTTHASKEDEKGSDGKVLLSQHQQELRWTRPAPRAAAHCCGPKLQTTTCRAALSSAGRGRAAAAATAEEEGGETATAAAAAAAVLAAVPGAPVGEAAYVLSMEEAVLSGQAFVAPSGGGGGNKGSAAA
eukprot:CAMPEP_0194588016 /NCGR_PEP_ID=MMETSP0292-20121207/19509_1 /TAXON_ID=39354 /ORGANISM="Heterosigma akashiwo, Strain CCMP2393" /LENGTH=212 /DNA_ID=CAMNT_0039444399 /DNA_START=56 /DNA_END=691 /DNA_ORIENTATION=-